MMFNVPSGGFSESWYWDAPVALPVTAGNPFDDLYQVRAALLSVQAVALGWRLTDIDNPRIGQLRLFPKTAQSQENPDVPTTAWLCIAKGANGVGHRQLWLRGAADDSVAWESAGNHFTRSPLFDRNLTTYINVLKAQALAWSIRSIASRKEQAGALYNVTAVTPSATVNGTLLVGLNVLNPLLPIIVSGFKKPLSVLNGTYLPNSGWNVAPTGVNLIGKVVPNVAAAGYPGGAQTRNQQTTLVKVKDIEVEFARERKVGRGFFQLRGRRAARA